MIKYYLGLDLGITSCGWAVMGEDDSLQDNDSEKYWMDDFGVRIFEAVEKPKDKTPLCEERRHFRSQRRLLRRRKHRLDRIKKLFEECGIISQADIDRYLNDLKDKNGRIKVTNRIKYDENNYVNSYVLRAKAQSERISKDQLAYVVLNLARHRGYLNAFDEEEKDSSKLLEAVNSAEEFRKNYATISLSVVNNPEFIKNNKISIRNNNGEYKFLFKRRDIMDELKKIIDEQNKYYPELGKADFAKKLYYLVEHQRDFEEGPGPKDPMVREKWEASMKGHGDYSFRKYVTFDKLVGSCKFSQTGEKVGMRSTLLFDFYHIANEVSKLTVGLQKTVDVANVQKEMLNYVIYAPVKECGSLKSKLKSLVLENVLAGYVLTSKEIEALPAYKNIDIKINFIKLCKQVFGDEALKNIDIKKINDYPLFLQLGELLSYNITPARRKSKLLELLVDHPLDQEKIDLLVNYHQTGTAKLGYTIMQKWLSEFYEGMPINLLFYGEEIYQKDQNQSNRFLSPIIDPDLASNQTTYRAVNQTRKVLKALFNKYHNFENINVEVASDLARSAKDRERKDVDNKRNMLENLKARDTLRDHNIEPNEMNVLKYKLWEQQNHKCMYSQIDISWSDLGKTDALQVDHIIPISVLQDDSFQNKVLVLSKYNQLKGKNTPLGWMASYKDEFVNEKKYINFVNQIRKQLSEKKYDYLMTSSMDDEALSGFVSRNLNDSRYIARYVYNWLNFELKKHYKLTQKHLVSCKSDGNYNVLTIAGTVTSFFRRKWLYDSPWGLDLKVRDITVWHHAVDASVLASFKNKSYIDFATDIVILNGYRMRYVHNRINIQEYREICDEVLLKWKNNKVYVPLAVERLSRIIEGENVNVMAPTISNLKETLEFRIPVKLKIDTKIENILEKSKNKSEKANEAEGRKVKVRVPEFVDVWSEEEFAKAKDEKTMKGDLHYPYVSYMQINKIKGSFTHSQSPMETKKDKVNKFDTVYKDGFGNKWDLSEYYGFYLDDDKNVKWITRFNIIRNKESFKNFHIVTRHQEIMFLYKNKWMSTVYTGKTGNQFSLLINGLVLKFKLPGRSSVLQVAFSNFKNGVLYLDDFKKINMLGKKV